MKCQRFEAPREWNPDYPISLHSTGQRHRWTLYNEAITSTLPTEVDGKEVINNRININNLVTVSLKGNLLLQFFNISWVSHIIQTIQRVYSQLPVLSYSILQDIEMEREWRIEMHRLLVLMLDTEEINTSKEYASVMSYGETVYETVNLSENHQYQT